MGTRSKIGTVLPNSKAASLFAIVFLISISLFVIYVISTMELGEVEDVTHYLMDLLI